ncbi:ankyrin, partial [Choiromyces venosus 120613-1]
MHDGRTLLNSAVRALSEDALTLLLDCGVDPNTVDDRGRTPLICATAGRHLTSIRALLLCPTLYHAAEHRDKSEVKALLDDGILDIIHDGRTLLNNAVSTLSEDVLTTLLDCGVDPNTVDDRGRTPL